MTRNDCYVDQFMAICHGIVVHSTATPGVDAAQFNQRWNNPLAPNKKSVHYFVDDTSIIQGLEVAKGKTRLAGHAGTGTSGKSANQTHVAFEICEPGTNVYNSAWRLINDPAASAAYFIKAYTNAVDLCALLCRLYGFDETAIIDHHEAYLLGIGSDHGDATEWLTHQGTGMDALRADVKNLLAGGTPSSGEAVRPAVYTVNTTSMPLNVREIPDANGKLIGTFAKGGHVIVTRQSNDWLYATNHTITGWASGDYLTDLTPEDAVTYLNQRARLDSPDFWLALLRKIGQGGEITYKDVRYLPDLFKKWAVDVK
jgi:hypothetical protein